MSETRINLTTKALRNALAAISKVVPTRSSNPALTSLRVKVSGDELELFGTNLEVDLRIRVPAEIQGDQTTFLVPAHLLTAIVGKAPGALVEMRYVESTRTLHISSAGSKNKVQTGDIEMYMVPEVKSGERVTIPAAPLAEALKAFTPLVGIDSFQAVMRNLLMDLTAERIRLAASNGYWVTHDDLAPAEGLSQDRKLLIPRPSLLHISDVISETETAHLELCDGVLIVEAGPMWLQVKLNEGDFPNYERVIPSARPMHAVLPVAQFAETLGRVSMFSDVNANNRGEVSLTAGRLTISAANDYGDSTEELEAVTGGTEPAMAVGINTAYVGQLLKALSGEMKLELSGSFSPIVMTCTGFPHRVLCIVTLKASS